MNLQFLCIHLKGTVSSSAHSNKLKFVKTRNTSSWAFLKNPGLTQQNQEANKPTGWGSNRFFSQNSAMQNAAG